jgi:diguanylate cyclase (GGDEF)-like protein
MSITASPEESSFRHLVDGKNCYCWTSATRRQANGEFVGQPTVFDLDAAKRFLFFPDDTLEEYIIHERAAVLPGERERCNNQIYDVLKRGESDTIVEYPLYDGGGRLRWTRELIHIEPTSDPDYYIISALCFDITETKQREIFQSKQSSLLEQVASGTDVKEISKATCDLLQSTFSSNIVAISCIDTEIGHVKKVISPHISDKTIAFLERMTIPEQDIHDLAEKMQVVPDIRKESRWEYCKKLYRLNGCPTIWTHPIRTQSGTTVGFLGIYLHTCRVPTDAEEQIIKASAQIIAATHERDEKAKQQQLYEQTMHDVVQGARCLLFHAKIRQVKIIKPDAPYPYDYDWDVTSPQGDQVMLFMDLEAETQHEYLDQFWRRRHPEDKAKSVHFDQEIFQQNISQYTQEFRTQDKYGAWHHIHEEVRVTSISPGQWEAIGVLMDVTSQRQAEEDTKWHASHDSLTGLPNRTHFLRYAQSQITKPDMHGALLFLDLNRFKQINDSLGHGQGDLLLKEVARRLQNIIREGQMVARMGGDEFVLLLPDINNRETVCRVAEQIQQALNKPFVLGKEPFFIGGSIGISLYPEDATDCDELLRMADIAMYHSKENGGITPHFYDGEMQMQRGHLARETQLRQAITKGEFFLHYQPEFATNSQEFFTVEALVRWKHPTLGTIPPNDFIPLAEETGLILPLGEWVLRTACQQVAQWEREGLQIRVSVNLSAKQFQDTGLATTIQSILDETGVAANRLDLEITESAMLRHGAIAQEIFDSLREMGVRLLVDDFGTGYASLAALRKYRLDILKIDRSFVQGMLVSEEDAAIIRVVMDLAAALKMGVIAEGVEQAEHYNALQEMGCQQMQGYYFSRPVPPEEIPELLTKFHTPTGKNTLLKLAA